MSVLHGSCFAEVKRGKGPLPVADYSLTAQALPDYAQVSSQTAQDAAATGRPQQGSTSNLQNASSTASGSGESNEHSRDQLSDSDGLASTHADSAGDGASASHNSSVNEQMHERQHSGSKASTSQDGSHSQSSAQQKHSRHSRHSKPGLERAAGQGSQDRGESRGVYSFCMCPGGQIVPTSTNPEELCINGMSFR